jgi:beta-lactamase class A
MLSLNTKEIVETVATTTLQQFADIGLKPHELAISMIQLGVDQDAEGNYRGDERIYPASVVKLFYLAAAHSWLEDGRLEETDELNRALTDMIVESSNDATHYVIDLLTATTSGPELPPGAMQEWAKKRNIVNEYFSEQGYQNLNICQKPWGDGPFGRERVFVGEEYTNRNMLTTNATAKLLAQIAERKCIAPMRSSRMLFLLERDYGKPSDDPEDQATKFFGAGLPPKCRLWSKAGWTSTVRHDAAIIELPGGKRFVLVAFTIGHSKEPRILPFIIEETFKHLGNH